MTHFLYNAHLQQQLDREKSLLPAAKIVLLLKKNAHLKLGSCVVMTPTSSSEGLKSMDRTVDRHEIAVCVETQGSVVKKQEDRINIEKLSLELTKSSECCLCFVAHPRVPATSY